MASSAVSTSRLESFATDSLPVAIVYNSTSIPVDKWLTNAIMGIMDTAERIVELLAGGKPLSGQEIANRLGLTRQAINRHIQRLARAGRIAKSGRTKNARYLLVHPGGEPPPVGAPAEAEREFARRYRIEGLREDFVFREVELFLGLKKRLSSWALEGFQYAFTEILNNAIDHSRSAACFVEAKVEGYWVSFAIRDEGIGIFKSIADKFALEEEAQAVIELAKGKRTTQDDRHTGEGIFFTSKCADTLVIRSHRITLTYDNRREDTFVAEGRSRVGTTVAFQLKANSRRKLSAVFEHFAPEDFDYQFQRTRLTVRMLGERYVSRSEAKRLLSGLEKFREIHFDFAGVVGIGQGFADELFRVFASTHPETKLVVENALPVVGAIIEHARHSQELG